MNQLKNWTALENNQSVILSLQFLFCFCFSILIFIPATDLPISSRFQTSGAVELVYRDHPN